MYNVRIYKIKIDKCVQKWAFLFFSISGIDSSIPNGLSNESK